MTQKRKSKNLILFVCLVSILFSGMFFYHAETDGYFHNSPTTNPVIKLCEETSLTKTQLCPETMLRSQISSVREQQKETLRFTSISLPVLSHPSHAIPNSIACLFEQADCIVQFSTYRIIGYIHNQDGAKS